MHILLLLSLGMVFLQSVFCWVQLLVLLVLSLDCVNGIFFAPLRSVAFTGLHNLLACKQLSPLQAAQVVILLHQVGRIADSCPLHSGFARCHLDVWLARGLRRLLLLAVLLQLRGLIVGRLTTVHCLLLGLH